MYSDQRRFRDAAARLGYSNYCEFHKDQEYEEHVCYECDGDGCPECCSECDGVGCEECLGEDEMSAVPAAPSTDEVELVGSRTREERDAEARTHAIDVEAESAKAEAAIIASARDAAVQERDDALARALQAERGLETERSTLGRLKEELAILAAAGSQSENDAETIWMADGWEDIEAVLADL